MLVQPLIADTLWKSRCLNTDRKSQNLPVYSLLLIKGKLICEYKEMLVPPAMNTDQRGVVRGVATAAVALVVVTAYCILRHPIQVSDDRLGLWLKWNTPKAACLCWNIATVGNLRFNSPADIMGAGLSTKPSPQVALMRGLLQNTLEQTVLAVLVQGSFAVLAPAEWLVLIPAYSILFVIGRVLFSRGYAHGAASRATGFALTILPSMSMLVGSCCLLFCNPW